MTASPGTRLAEEIALAEALPRGPIRAAWLEGCTDAGWRAMSEVVRRAQEALAYVREARLGEALDAFDGVSVAAAEARPCLHLLEAENARRRPGG